MKTIQVTVEVSNTEVREELIAGLIEAGFDGFEEKEDALLSYINEESFDEKALKDVLGKYNLNYNELAIEEQNWNAVWESNFDSVVVDQFCAIRAEFHAPIKNVEHEIIITPKMSFGTGHHATTYMMISEMRKLAFKNKKVADFGTGTGVLAILAEKLGAEAVWAIDYDDWSIDNASENIVRNSCSRIKLEKANGFSPATKFDVILANINKNVILSNLDGLLFGVNTSTMVLLSGLLKQDEADVLSAFEPLGFRYVSMVERNNWICILLQYDIKM